MSAEDARFHLAWLMWCYGEGYVAPEDREVGIGNWLLFDDDNLVPEDRQTKAHLLAMADEVLALL